MVFNIKHVKIFDSDVDFLEKEKMNFLNYLKMYQKLCITRRYKRNKKIHIKN